MDPGASTSRQHTPPKSKPPKERRQLSLEDREQLAMFFPHSLDWILANENIRLGDMVDTALCIIRGARERQAAEDGVDWEELERDNPDEAEVDLSGIGSLDPYGVSLAPCFVCGKTDVGTRLTSCGICCKKAHISCLPWKARQDPRTGHFYWECNDHELPLRLAQGGHSGE
jgi:hypothetical protein